MKAVILAAGMGTRLGTLIPKPLTSITNEKTILDYQVEKLSKVIGKDNIIVIVGYKKEIIMEKHPDLLFVYNHAYTQTNTAKSLLCALSKIDEDVIWMNGDVYFDKGVLNALLKSKDSACLVNQSKCQEEEIKYTLGEDGYIKKLSKTIKKDALGEAVGINMVKEKDLKNFKKSLERVNDTDYFEKALENLSLSGKIKIFPVGLDGLYCKEIDFPEDLKEVEKYLSKEKES